MNNYTTESFQKYERKRPSKHLLDHSLDKHSERHNKHSCVKQAWRMERMNKRTNWEDV